MKKNKMLFKNHTKYSKKNYNSFIKFHNAKFGLIYDIYTIFIIILLLYCFITALKGQAYILSVTLFIGMIVFVAYRIFEPLQLHKKQMKSNTITKENEIIYYFYERTFKIREKSKMVRVRYWQLHKIYETEEFFYLYLTKRYALLVDKASFTLGTSQEFAKYMKKKLKLKYKCECEK